MFDWLRRPPHPDATTKARELADRLIAKGNRAEHQGRYPEACELYRSAVATAPRYAKALINLGIGLEALGDAPGAIRAYEDALAADGDDPYANYNLAKLLFARNDLARASRLLQIALERKPDFAEARVVLASVLEEQGDTDAAVRSLEATVGSRSDYSGAWHNYGVLLAKVSRYGEARAALERAILLSPEFIASHYQLGRVQAVTGKLEEAVTSFRNVLSRQPDHIDARVDLAAALWRLGRLDEAIECYEEALRREPASATSCLALGNALVARGELHRAVELYDRALRLKPDCIDAIYNIGAALRHLGRHEEATARLEAAYQLKATTAGEWYRLALAFRDADRWREGLECLRKAVSLDPEYVEARWAFAMHQVPAIYSVDDDPGEARAAFSAELTALERWFEGSRIARGFETVGTVQPFLLAYHEADNRELLQRYGGLCAKLMRAWHDEQRIVAGARERKLAGPVRVGIVSSFFSSHSVWSALVKGWFREIDPKRIALHAFYLRSSEDEETRFARSRAAHFDGGTRDLRAWVDAILRQDLDVLIYPEVGMDEMTLKLASLRLAPVQAAAWGHPETTGLPTIDYYLSASAFEPASAQRHYSERLIELPGLGCHYAPIGIAPTQPELEKWHLDPERPLLVCPGVPFKYAPQHDTLLAEIAKHAPQSQFVFFTFNVNPRLSRKLQERLRHVFAQRGLALDQHVRFIPWLNGAQFYGLLHRADLFLDTVGFSGFNTAMHAVESALPVVTREGAFMRGRLASGILRRMGLADLVSASDEDYVSRAVQLATDAGHRAEVRSRMRRARPALFGDLAPIRGLEEFLLEAARR